MIDYITEDLGNGIIRVNLEPERWYFKDDNYEDPYPSPTWIISEGYPKQIGFLKWLSNLKDWDEGQKIMKDAGDRGSKVHAGIEKLLTDSVLKWDDLLPPDHEPFNPGEWLYIMSFQNFYNDHPLKVDSLEETVWNEEPKFAGTCDFKGTIILPSKGKLEPVEEDIILDWKTSSAIYPTHLIQVSAYAKALDYDLAGIVRLRSRHKKGYELRIINKSEIEKYYNLFLNVYEIWKDSNPDATPRWKEITSELKLEIK